MNRTARVKMFVWRIFHSRLGNFLAVVNLYAVAFLAISFRGAAPNLFGMALSGLFSIVNLPVFLAYVSLAAFFEQVFHFTALRRTPVSLVIVCFLIYLQWTAIGCFIETTRAKRRARREARTEDFAFNAHDLPIAKTFLDLPEASDNQLSDACPSNLQNLKTAKLDISHYRRVYK